MGGVTEGGEKNSAQIWFDKEYNIPPSDVDMLLLFIYFFKGSSSSVMQLRFQDII